MGRPAGTSGADTRRAVREAAIARIYEHGFEAMNLRDLAADVNLRLGSLYNHVPQKQELLYSLIEEIMTELLRDFGERMAELSDPMERLLAFVEFHIEWHTVRKQETFIGNMELRSLTAPQYKRIVAMREQYEGELRKILAEGKRKGLWDYEDLRVTALALLSLLTGINAWYRENGRLKLKRLIRLYQKLALQMLDAST
jgi:AcrR family transcriptional regulator